MSTAKRKTRKTAGLLFEKELLAQGYRLVGGMDEAGRGPLAGPVCAAIVIFEPGTVIRGVNDSKQLDADEREELYHKIVARALAYGIGLACAAEIDHYNILRATKLAARRALKQMPIMPDCLLLDALTLDRVTLPQKAITQGDSKSFSIAAASILAKVTRDRLMASCAEHFPHYGFKSNKGYGTVTHRRVIAERGPCTLHRQTFLESWFGTAPVTRSLLYDQLCQKLADCTDAAALEDAIAIARDCKAWLPVCEWNDLLAMARSRLAALSQ